MGGQDSIYVVEHSERRNTGRSVTVRAIVKRDEKLTIDDIIDQIPRPFSHRNQT